MSSSSVPLDRRPSIRPLLGYGVSNARSRPVVVVFALLGLALGVHVFVVGVLGQGSSSGLASLSSRPKLDFGAWSYRHQVPEDDSVPAGNALRDAAEAGGNLFEAPQAQIAAEETLPPITILTPLSPDSYDDIPRFVDMLCRLSYPRNRLDLGFLLPEVYQDDTIALLSEVTMCQGYSTALADDVPAFRSVTYIVEPTPPAYPESIREEISKDRHSLAGQRERRARMAKARNLLLTSMLGRVPDAEWILHLDVDVVTLTIDEPKGMTAINVPFIEKLLDYGRTGALGQTLEEGEQPADIVAPNLLVRKRDTEDFWVYDWNAWMSHVACHFWRPQRLIVASRPYAENPESLAIKANLTEDTVLFEGVMATNHTTMAHLAEPWADEDKTMELDGIGGNFLSRASLHRQGVVFPSWPIDHQIESEGLAKIAKAMGARIVGLPNVIILHKKPTEPDFDAQTIPRERPATLPSTEDINTVEDTTTRRQPRSKRHVNTQYRRRG